jgi:phosphate:Na+ symporter
MSGSLVLLNLAGAVALLLFATRMVRTGVERAYGDVLRRRLRAILKNPLLAVGAGGVLAICLQSATAVALIVGAFVGSGIIGGVSGLLAALGADLGSAIIAKLLSFNLSFLTPLCLVIGTALFMSTDKREALQVGRILIGIGLLILSLRLIGEASEPLRHSELLPVIVQYLASDKITAVLVAAIMTWLFHSSVAAILLFAALAQRHLIPLDLGVVLVLGANIGGGVIAVMLSRASPPRSRIVPIGNLMIRATGALVALIVVLFAGLPFERLGATPEAAMLNWHITFNVLMILAGMPLAPLVTKLAERVATAGQKDEVAGNELVEMSVLDDAALDRPMQALGNATREVVRRLRVDRNHAAAHFELYEKL